MKVGVIQALDVPRGRLADPDDFAITTVAHERSVAFFRELLQEHQ
jgi:hypothetical protein